MAFKSELSEWLNGLNPFAKTFTVTALIFLVTFSVTVADYRAPKPRRADNEARTPAHALDLYFRDLNKTEQGQVREALAHARQLYSAGKYNGCLTELAKIHRLLPAYRESQEIHSFCEQGRKLRKRPRELASPAAKSG